MDEKCPLFGWILVATAILTDNLFPFLWWQTFLTQGSNIFLTDFTV